MDELRATTKPKSAPHVVIVGGGFGGLTATKSLARSNVRVTLIDRTNHHLFQPLLYQVATAGLSPAEIASPIRSIVRKQSNAAVLLDEVTSIDLASKRVKLRDDEIAYDYLILATGAQTNYFGHDWERFAPGLKNLDDAVEVRRRVLLAFEAAEREHDPAKRARLLTLVSIGGGPTGVELAGALAELARFVLARDFRSINPRSARVVLVEAGDEILSTFGGDLSHKARKQLEDLGVEVHTRACVTCIDDDGVELVAKGDGAKPERIASATVVWAAGVRATPLTSTLGVPTDRLGRVLVENDCSLPGHPEAFAIGDMASFTHQEGGKPLPGVSPVAMQQARSVARNIARSIKGEPREPFHYFDKGSMATIGRSRAVAESHGLRLSGLLAWLTWLLVHIWYLIGFRNRFIVLFSWFWSYVAYKRGARLITGHRLEPGRPHDELPAPSPSTPVPPARERASAPTAAS